MEIQPDIIERYQIMLDKDPRSQVFAPLAEAYRKMDLLEEAFRICVRGVQFHPHFAGGRIALAKIFIEKEDLESARKELEKAIEFSSDNILAHQLLGEIHLKLKKPKEALRSYKMVLFLAPNNERAMKAVHKLESLTADEYDDDLFAMKPLKELTREEEEDPVPDLMPLEKPQPGSERFSELDRYLSLADAFIVRNDLERAQKTLEEAGKYYAGNKEVSRRMEILLRRNSEPDDAATEAKTAAPIRRSRVESRTEAKIEFLQDLLDRLKSRTTP